MITPFFVWSTGRAQPTAAATTSPGTSLDIDEYAVGTMAPGTIFGSGTSSTPGGRMLETRTRLMLPMPAASRALSKALSGVEPSALPAVPAATITFVHPIGVRRLLVRGACLARSSRGFRSLIVSARQGNASEKFPVEAAIFSLQWKTD
jgi:hypothetical protein